MGIVGTLFALPSMVAFYGAWLVASLFRPFLLGTTLCLLMNIPAAHEKIRLFVTTFEFLAFCKDKKWKKPSMDPALAFQQSTKTTTDDDDATGNDDDDKDKDKDKSNDDGVEQKTIIFLRHGESTWNDTFNKGERSMAKFVMGFIPGLLKASFLEWYFFVTGQSSESWFFDSPLSKKGQEQAQNVQAYLRDTNPEYATPKEAKLLKILTGTSDEKSQLTSSNLRRAMSTIVIGLQDRLNKRIPKDDILVLTELQEVSFNPDALSISPAKSPLISSWMDSPDTKLIYEHQMDTSLNNGNKSIDSNGLERMQAYAQLVFESIDAPNVVATGHSYWFRAFFQTYLPHSFEHVCKKKKLCNGGIAGFTFQRKKVAKAAAGGNGDGYEYMIDPNSIVVLYGGF
mmetsp:Transcript_16599/g.46402  ORF Transcript_16599/g.46402 Transcript_16599/m.46402 type:complete len:398 (-) Transcript_16599:1502-2695(-)